MPRKSRKESILVAALECFTEYGVESTTIEMIRDRADASIGSLYHHFGNKERIIGALYLAGLADYVTVLESRMDEATDAQACIRLLVTSYIDWVVANPDWARFILHSRSRVEAGEMGPALLEANQQNYLQIYSRVEMHRKEGCFLKVPPDCFVSIIIGPSQEFARNWLAGRTRTHLADCRDMFADIAWRSVRA